MHLLGMASLAIGKTENYPPTLELIRHEDYGLYLSPRVWMLAAGFHIEGLG